MARRYSVRNILPVLGGARLILGGTVIAQAQPSSATPSEQVELPEIQVIGVTPVHGVGVAKDKFRANVQEASGEEIHDSQAVGLGEFMSENMASVWVNEGQNNPLQPNVSYRGYTVSPLLGLPQGLAVYQDGVRINEPFGDTVNFSLI